MKNALKRMKIQQFFKKNRTAQNLYDKAMGAVDLGYNAGMGAASTALAPHLMAGQMSGTGLYTGRGLYTGMGDYMPSSNDLISKSSMSIVPSFGSTDDDSIIVRRREYVSEIFGPDFVNNSTTTVYPFVLQEFPINPGLERTFPWLSQIAQNYDEYELLQCIFTFKSTTTESSNSDNGQVGTVIMVTNYNAAAPAFRDKATMQRYMGAISARLTESTLHGVECDPDKLSGSIGEYVRTNPVVTGQDLKTYDHGKFQIAIANASAVYANVSIGELWVSYTVKLRKSKFFTSLGFGITKDIFVSNDGETTEFPFGPVDSSGNPTNLLKAQQNNLGCLVRTSATAGVGKISITFPAAYSGYVKVLLFQQGGTFSSTANWRTTLVNNLGTGNIKLVEDLYGIDSSDVPSYGQYQVGGSQVTVMLHIRVDIATNGVDNTLTLPPTIQSSVSLNQSYLDISEYNAISSGINQGINTSDAPIWVNSSGVVVVP